MTASASAALGDCQGVYAPPAGTGSASPSTPWDPDYAGGYPPAEAVYVETSLGFTHNLSKHIFRIAT